MKLLVLSVILFLEFVWIARIKGEPDWTFEILEMNTTDNTPDLLDTKVYLKRIARGRFVIDGTITIKEDLTDDTIVYGEAFYSRLPQQFVRTPFHIPKIPLSTYFNTFHKELFMDSYNECATNMPINDASETFVPPLKKGVISLENCTFNNDNFPSHLRTGFYRVHFSLTNQVETKLIVLVQVESKYL